VRKGIYIHPKTVGATFWGCLARLLLTGSSGGAREPSVPSKRLRLLCFLLKKIALSAKCLAGSFGEVRAGAGKKPYQIGLYLELGE
jgi:hypothetical protein